MAKAKSKAKGVRSKSVATEHRKIITRTWDGATKFQTSTGSILAFRRFIPQEDPERDRVILVYTQVPPAVIRGEVRENFCKRLGEELPMARKDIEFFVNREIWTVL